MGSAAAGHPRQPSTDRFAPHSACRRLAISGRPARLGSGAGPAESPPRRPPAPPSGSASAHRL